MFVGVWEERLLIVMLLTAEQRSNEGEGKKDFIKQFLSRHPVDTEEQRNPNNTIHRSMCSAWHTM